LGVLDKTTLDSVRGNFGGEMADTLEALNLESQGSKGIDSPEYMKSFEMMESFVGGLDENGKFWDAKSKMLVGVEDLITGDFTQDAKLKLMSIFAASLYTDATYSDIQAFADGGQSEVVKEFEDLGKKESPQRRFAKHIASTLFSKTAFPFLISAIADEDTAENLVEFSEEATRKKSLVSAESAYGLLRSFWNEDRLGSITEDNYDDVIANFNEQLDAAIGDSSMRRLEKKELEFRKQLSEIIGER